MSSDPGPNRVGTLAAGEVVGDRLGLASDCAFGAEFRKSHFKTRTSNSYDSLVVRISLSVRHCRVLNPGVTLSFFRDRGGGLVVREEP